MKTGLLAAACLIALLSAAAAARAAYDTDARTGEARDAGKTQVSPDGHRAARKTAFRPIIGGHGDDVVSFIAQHDDSGDGRLTWTEFETFRRNRFDATDENGDGTVDVEEYVREFEDRSRRALEQRRAGQMEQTERRFAALDADRDGRVSRAEFDASGERQFAGFLKMPADAGEDAASGEDAAAAAERRRGLGMPTSHTREGFLALFDLDGDGRVDRAEFDRARAGQFARTDADGDGVLERDEYLAEFEDRLDRRIATLGDGSDRQTRVRFGALDADKDGRMTFAEYQVSGKRLFDGADRDKDGMVDAADAALPPPARPQRARRPAAAAGDSGN